MLLEALADDQACLVGTAALQQRHRASLLDTIDVGLRQHAAHLIVEIAEARDDDHGRRHAVGDLDEIANGLLEALLGVVEEAQVLDLIDAEDERGPVDGPSELAEALDDLEGAAVARVGIKRRDGLP